MKVSKNNFTLVDYTLRSLTRGPNVQYLQYGRLNLSIGKNEDAKIQLQNESVDDPLMVFVNQCNAENDGGDAKLPNEPDWNTTDADLKEIIALTPQFHVPNIRIGFLSGFI